MKETFTLVATAAAGLEAVVGRELRELGYDTQVENGKVRFQGDVRAIAETNLWLRAAPSGCNKYPARPPISRPIGTPILHKIFLS